MTTRFWASVAAVAILLALAAAPAASAQQRGAAPAVKNQRARHRRRGHQRAWPEAGVWVIAEPPISRPGSSRSRHDDKGRYVLPDLPEANYRVWVRGYGLVDSPEMRAVRAGCSISPPSLRRTRRRGALLSGDLLASRAEDPDAASSAARAPFREGDAAGMADRLERPGVRRLHQLGQESTATLPAASAISRIPKKAWMQPRAGRPERALHGEPAGRPTRRRTLQVFRRVDRFGRRGRAAAGEPPRPQGVERNLVVTLWGWGDAKTYMHDAISTDRRNPTVNAYGKIFGAPEYSNRSDRDPRSKTNTATQWKAPVKDPEMPNRSARVMPRRSLRRSLRPIGRGKDLEPARQQPQPDVRQGGPAVADRGGPRPGQSGLL